MTLTRALFLCLLAVSAPSFAQTYTAAKIQFSNLGPFTQQQLEDASGIHPGTSFTAKDLGAAAQRLVDTGFFDDVGATLDGRITAITVKFEDKPTPADHMLPVSFSNLVWLTPAEIDATIKASIPLYTGFLPENSPHQDEIKHLLTDALAAKSVNARIAFDTFEPTLRHPRREIDFKVLHPAPRVANIKLSGVTAGLAPLVQKSVNATARTAYTAGPADQTTVDSILAPLLDAGYIQATLTSIALEPTLTPAGDASVILSARLIPGDIFHLASITFAGTPILSAADFSSAAKLHPGDSASHAALLETLTPIDAAYRRKGYMDVVIHATPTLDDAAHTVAYIVTVDPGEQYRVHEVTANNLDPVARADFDKYFLDKVGELYNPEYVAKFLKNNTALFSFNHYSAAFKAYADPNTHTVDLEINFARASN